MDGLGLPQSQYPRTLERKKFKKYAYMSAMLENTLHIPTVNNTCFNYTYYKNVLIYYIGRLV